MKAVFMGTPEFAVPCLDKLNGYCDVVCVVTQTDKPKGRGKTMQSPPVKLRADELGIPCIQPKTLRDEEVQNVLASYGADVFVVVAYGKILPKEVLDIPPMGCINVHGSILPEYRGAAPMQRSLIDGKKLTGITTMYMNEGLDTGDMLLKEEVEITPELNYGELSDIMSGTGAELLIKTLDGLSDGSLKGAPQNGELATYAQKIDKSELKIDFSKSAESIHNLIRGVYPSLSAYGYTENAKGKKMIKFASSSFIPENGGGAVGEVILCDDKRSEIHVCCGEGILVIKELIPEGKGKMRSADYIRGRQIKTGDIIF
jgi:methionyl-tRNA formyltransferase